jgi:hypothetical protein
MDTCKLRVYATTRHRSQSQNLNTPCSQCVVEARATMDGALHATPPVDPIDVHAASGNGFDFK